jgi:lysophospholipase L1-like esterase
MVSDSPVVLAQDTADKYPFIRTDLNRIDAPDSLSALSSFWEAFHNMMLYKDEQLHIVHFGGSHIQADIYTHVLRAAFQHIDSDVPGARGFLFPYSAAHTNNPYNYKVDYSGEWDGHRSSVSSHQADWGVVGVTATTNDLQPQITITFRDTLNPVSINRLLVMTDATDSTYVLQVNRIPHLVKTDTTAEGYWLLYFDATIDTIVLPFERMNDTAVLSFFGCIAENNQAGITYHALGVNGSSFKSFERCARFSEQLPYLHPDLVVISIGTNDTSDPDFDAEAYKRRYGEFIRKVLEVNPQCALLLTVPNDSYIRRKYHNKNLVAARAAIYELAAEYHAGVWDLYSIMGGAYSAKKWRNAGLMKTDLVHFTREGYEMKGAFMFDAMMADYDNWLVQHGYIDESSGR